MSRRSHTPGSEASTKTHFNEIYVSPPGASLLAFPADGQNAPNTVEQLIMERIWKQQVWAEDMSNTGDLVAERDRFQASLEIQSEREKFLTERTTKFLNTNYPQFSRKQIIYLRLDKRTKGVPL